jgi:hypothetical protein
MNFIIKDTQLGLVVSITTGYNGFIYIFATNFERYFIEKAVSNDVLDERMKVIFCYNTVLGIGRTKLFNCRDPAASAQSEHGFACCS